MGLGGESDFPKKGFQLVFKKPDDSIFKSALAFLGLLF